MSMCKYNVSGTAAFIVLLSALLPWAFTEIVATPQRQRQDLRTLLSSWLAAQFPFADRPWNLLMLALALPHVFYYLVWTRAEKWANFCREGNLVDPCRAFAAVAYALKVWQAFALSAWLLVSREEEPLWLPSGGVLNSPASSSAPVVLAGRASNFFYDLLSGLHPARALLGIELVVLGQILNAGVYRAIGKDGVYYGCRLGKEVPWVDGFPFDAVPHPQYVGSAASIWGLTILSSGSIPFGLPVIVSIYYAFSSWVEATL